MDVLVIGGSRFIGKSLVRQLLEEGHDVTVLNRGKTEQRVSAPFLKPEKHEYPTGVKILRADRTNHEELGKQIEGKKFEAIIDTCGYNERDIQGILDYAPKELEHYVFVSTASVYELEKIEFLPLTEDGPIGSEADDYPETYSRDKRRAESLLKRAYKESNFPITIFRPAYIYGPYNPVYREFYFFDRIADQKPIYLPGSGEYLLDFIHTNDMAWLLTSPLEKKHCIGEIYNATGQAATTLNTYTKIQFKVLGKETEVINYDPKILQKEGMKPENREQMFPFMFDRHLILSKEKAAIELGYKPKPLPRGLRETYDWYLEKKNPDWKGDYVFDEKIAKEITKLV